MKLKSSCLLSLVLYKYWNFSFILIEHGFIDSAPSGSIPEDEDIEEEFKKLELEVTAGQKLNASTSESGVNIAAGETVATVSDDSLSAALSNLKLVEETGKETANQKLNFKSKSKLMELGIS